MTFYTELIKSKPEIARIIGIDLKTLKLEEIYHCLGLLPQYQANIDKKWGVYNKTTEQTIFLYDITSSYFEGTKNVLTANNLQPETNPNIIIDSLSTYSNTLPANDVHEMPRIVVVRKSKVVTDTVFSLSDEENTGEFQKFIINSGKEQLRLKK